ncbi:MAG: hypothetical protein WAO76_10870 [Georgfuchsia sp.]
MPTIFIKDDLRASVEAATGGQCTVLYTASGAPSYMRVIPKFNLQDIDASLGNGVHPAFIVGGVEKSEIFIGQYQGIVKNGELLSLPGVDPSASANFDAFLSYARANGAGWHIITNAEWAAIALWCWKNGFMPRGNSNYGNSSDATWEQGRRQDGIAPGTVAGTARTLTGSGPASWRHDNTSAGIADLNGNVWEWCAGMRVNAGEINIIQNNDAALNATDMSVGSAAWKAIDGGNGALVAAGSANAIKYDVAGVANYTMVRASGAAFEGMTNPSGTPVGATALQIAKSLGLYPVNAELGGDGFWLDVTGERLPVRGGIWSYGALDGVFALHLGSARTNVGTTLGSRPAFVA